MMKNYVYAVTRVSDSHLVDSEIRKSHELRNKLCELELARREELNELLLRLAPDYVSACEQVDSVESHVDELREKIQEERRKQRTKQPLGCEAISSEIKQCVAELKQLRGHRKEQKQLAYSRDEVRSGMESINEKHKEREKTVLHQCDLYWPTKGLIVQSCKSFRSGAPPRFRRWDGEGQLALQLQGGMDCASAYDSDTRFYLQIPESLDLQLRTRGKAKRQHRKSASAIFRIGSDGRDPIFVKLGISFHRHLPRGKIKWVYLERRMLANRIKYSLRLTVDCEETDQQVDVTGKAVAVTLGWRMDKDGLRVARFQGDDGFTGRLKLSTDHVNDYEKISSVRSQRKMRFNNRVTRLRQWIKAASTKYDTPEWLSEAARSMHAWRSESRLASLVTRWTGERFTGDELVFSLLQSWQRWDRKRWQHERRLSVRIVRRRNDLFRLVAKRLRERYEIAYIADLDAEQLSRNAEPEELSRDNTAAHRHSKWAAVSTFAKMVEEQFPKSMIRVDTYDLVKACAQCGHVNKRPKTGYVIQCQQCSKSYSMSDNALANVHARGEAAVKSGALLAIVEAQELAAQKKAEALAKMQEANRAARKRKREALQGQDL